MPLRCGAREAPSPLAMAARRERCSLLLARRGTRLLLLSRVSSLTVPFPRLDPAQTSLVATPRSRFAPSSSRAATPRARDRRARVAFFVSHSTRALAEAIAARVRAAHDVDVAWFTVSERDGTIDPPLPSADALHAAVTKPLAAAAASSPRSPIGIEGPSDAAPSAAALIAKGEAAVRLGDHRRANEAFAAARAMQELERSRSASPPGGSRAAGAGAESESDSSGAAVVAAFAPFVLALLPDGAAHLGVAVDAATATNVRARTTTVVGSNPTGGVGGVFVNLGDASETAVARAGGDMPRRRRRVRTGGARGRRHGRAERYRSSLGRQRGGTRRRLRGRHRRLSARLRRRRRKRPSRRRRRSGSRRRRRSGSRRRGRRRFRRVVDPVVGDRVLRVARPARGVRASRRFAHGVGSRTGVGAGRRRVPIARTRACARNRAPRGIRRERRRARDDRGGISPRRRDRVASTRSRRRRIRVSNRTSSSRIAPRRRRGVRAFVRRGTRRAPRARRITRDDVPRRGDARDDRGGALRVRERRVESRRRVARRARRRVGGGGAPRRGGTRGGEDDVRDGNRSSQNASRIRARRTLRVSTRGG